MQIEQERNLYKQCLRITEEHPGKSDFREQMLLYNKIVGLLEFDVLKQDDGKIYEYCVAGLESLEVRCDCKRIGCEELKRIFNGILTIVYAAREYMLIEADFVLLPRAIFFAQDEEMRLVYFPGYAHGFREQLCSLAEFLLDKIDYTDEGAVLLGYSIYMKTKSETCTIEELAELLKASQKKASENSDASESLPVKADTVTEDKPVSAEIVSRPFQRDLLSPGSEGRTAQKILSLPRLPMAIVIAVIIVVAVIEALLFIRGRISFGESKLKAALVLAAGVFAVAEAIKLARWMEDKLQNVHHADTEQLEEGETVIIEDTQGAEALVLISSDCPTIAVTRFPFVIGRDRDLADFVLDKPGISRAHLEIKKKGEMIFVTDCGSTNGTFINGSRLKKDIPLEIRQGDELKLANCTYYYNLKN